MKILFLAHRIPFPPDKGDKIRSFHELRAMSELGHEVHLFAFTDRIDDLNYQVELSRFCASVQVIPIRHPLAGLRALINLIGHEPLSVGYYSSRKMRRSIGQIVENVDFDAVFVFSSTMAQYVPQSMKHRTVLDMVDVDSEKWCEYANHSQGAMSKLYALEHERLRAFEYDAIQSAAYTILSSPIEASLLDRLDEFTRRARLRVMTNGVDLDYFKPPVKSSCGNIKVVFTGAMNYFPNIDGVCRFAESVWPLIRESSPDAEFLIVGRDPVKRVRKLAKTAGIRVTGTVDDVRPYLGDATVIVVPLKIARGVQNKLLEAMAMGKASVVSPETANGLNIVDGEHALIAGSPEEFATAVIRLIRDKALRETLGSNSRLLVEEEYNWRPHLQFLTDLIESVARKDTSFSISHLSLSI